MIDKTKILELLESITLDESQNIVESNCVTNINVSNNHIHLDLLISNPTLQFKEKIKSQVQDAILSVYANAIVNVNFSYEKATQESATSGIKNIIAVASGKGGVGKSTVSSNLAVSLQKMGYSVGLIDADIYGPSVPLMFDAEDAKPKQVKKNNQILMSPIESYGVKVMSIGFFSHASDAIVWRGPMATKALKTIINQTDWGNLDY